MVTDNLKLLAMHDKLLKKIEEIPAGPMGPRGADGSVGEDGRTIVQQMDVQALSEAIYESNKSLIGQVINAMPKEPKQIRTVHVGNVTRNFENRIEGLDMNMEYET
tara:strand:+ start:51 stop:368 length:318 start_codon:yes stop_codon:yes gene_type:complete